MEMTKECLKIDGNDLAHALQQARTRLDGAEGELFLDFSSVQRLDTASLKAMEELSAAAREKQVKVTLRGTNVSTYKVLRLARLDSKFNFLT